MEKEVKKEIAQNIKRYRKLKGINQKDLSEILNVSIVSISKWENGIVMPEVAYLYDMSKLFDISIDSFLGRFALDKTYCKEKYTIEKIKELIKELEKSSQ